MLVTRRGQRIVSLMMFRSFNFLWLNFLQMFLCENTIYTQKAMDTVLTHELIHAFDNCRVKYNPDNLRHLACTEVFHSCALYLI